MPLHQTIALFLIALIVAGFSRAVRTDFKRPRFWLVLIAASTAMSAASAAVARTRHSGTGFTTSYGWPKPFYFHYLSEGGELTRGWDAIYFAGNAMVFASALLIVWTVVRRNRPAQS